MFTALECDEAGKCIDNDVMTYREIINCLYLLKKILNDEFSYYPENIDKFINLKGE